MQKQRWRGTIICKQPRLRIEDKECRLQDKYRPSANRQLGDQIEVGSDQRDQQPKLQEQER